MIIIIMKCIMRCIIMKLCDKNLVLYSCSLEIGDGTIIKLKLIRVYDLNKYIKIFPEKKVMNYYISSMMH